MSQVAVVEEEHRVREEAAGARARDAVLTRTRDALRGAIPASEYELPGIRLLHIVTHTVHTNTILYEYYTTLRIPTICTNKYYTSNTLPYIIIVL